MKLTRQAYVVLLVLVYRYEAPEEASWEGLWVLPGTQHRDNANKRSPDVIQTWRSEHVDFCMFGPVEDLECLIRKFL